jgi:hypothetical protein
MPAIGHIESGSEARWLVNSCDDHYPTIDSKRNLQTMSIHINLSIQHLGVVWAEAPDCLTNSLPISIIAC